MRIDFLYLHRKFPKSAQICRSNWSNLLHYSKTRVKSKTNSRMGGIKGLSTSVRKARKSALERRNSFLSLFWKETVSLNSTFPKLYFAVETHYISLLFGLLIKVVKYSRPMNRWSKFQRFLLHWIYLWFLISESYKKPNELQRDSACSGWFVCLWFARAEGFRQVLCVTDGSCLPQSCVEAHY